MDWNAIGAVAEIIGSIGVLLTLVYVAIQIRQNTDVIEDTKRAVAAQASRDVDLYLGRWHQDLAREPELRQINLRGSTLEASEVENWSTDEWYAWRALALSLLLPIQSNFMNEKMGIADSPAPLHQLRMLHGLVSLYPAWRSCGRSDLTPGFREAVESTEMIDMQQMVFGETIPRVERERRLCAT